MLLLILGLALFWAGHLFKVLKPAERAALDDAIGPGAAKGVMGAVLLLALVLIVIGYQNAPFINVWYPPAFLVHVNNLLMAVAAVFFVAGNIKSGVRRKIRHPQLTAVKTWAVAHLLVNGDLASIILFGGMLAWAVVSVIGINKRDGAWERPEPGTFKGKVIHAAVAVVVLLVMLLGHMWAGVWPFPQGAA